MSLNYVFNVGVRSGHYRHPNTVEAAELLQECIHFFGPLCIYEGHLESKERFAIKKYLLIIGKKKNMQVLSHTFTYFST